MWIVTVCTIYLFGISSVLEFLHHPAPAQACTYLGLQYLVILNGRKMVECEGHCSAFFTPSHTPPPPPSRCRHISSLFLPPSHTPSHLSVTISSPIFLPSSHPFTSLATTVYLLSSFCRHLIPHISLPYYLPCLFAANLIPRIYLSSYLPQSFCRYLIPHISLP